MAEYTAYPKTLPLILQMSQNFIKITNKIILAAGHLCGGKIQCTFALSIYIHVGRDTNTNKTQNASARIMLSM